MKIGIVLKDRCHDDALKCEVPSRKMANFLQEYLTSPFLVTERYIVAVDQIKYIYKIND